ncbi:excinuclease ABC subunit C [Candidatus Shapirobacteria bacterium CG10_big_fil_rev_8_21_14_0_10_40_9]|uniref:Excinuclease ABC subunit C n=1 Tax=Candidatus Shapirobacteria bacterium CG10_big_fil_rev_8_21_14_0_10_40_9 TaxID=1974888 RepID=A0A2M8L474_9BACT|nr:MAG: excinuclease ABC subunit C [Candidatus Shapirobacteria bacterium CG10_big_fil_rev_8_21_14_0_10_40_9]
MFYVYVLQSLKDKKLYIGFTTDLRKRLKDHNAGGSKSTSPRRPLMLIFYEAYISEKDARRREKYLKTTKGKKGLKLMLADSIS